MKTFWITTLAGLTLLAAPGSHAGSYSYTNTIAVTPGNPAAAVGFAIPQFNPTSGSLETVTLSVSSSATCSFSWTNSPNAGVTALQTNALTVLYGGSEVLAQKTFLAESPNYPTPLPHGSYGTEVWGSTLNSDSTFSLAPDLHAFTGAGVVPVSAEYYSQATVTPYGGSVAWSVAGSSSFTAIVTYDFLVVPEPRAPCLAMLGALVVLWRGRKA